MVVKTVSNITVSVENLSFNDELVEMSSLWHDASQIMETRKVNGKSLFIAFIFTPKVENIFSISFSIIN